MRPAGNGRLLELLAVGHAAVGALVYRRELTRLASRRPPAASYRGPEAAAFWFFVNSPLLLIIARLMRRAELRGDAAALRDADAIGLAAALLAGICLPRSGFWAWAAISIRGLRDARRLA